MRVTRVVSWTKSSVAAVLSPDMTEPAARAKRKASDWSSKYKMTSPDIRHFSLSLTSPIAC